ncbi:hypothetical protein BDV25DRAFT_117274 [Aspergillus avenaceus]|uniref:Zn(2)-C6 fungal-type domain-containing protein n=1 Tax=Aspergillus avenaceus TaxID=36643 RepID=A0A5N6TUV7_ASPAV|nr:hypothetical protein BDV25DRAFT_117274 [Aspergillus avenaceus]
MQPVPVPSRRRRYVKRSVTGCRTCRTRRIKCDEAPDACNNCTSTGRKCEGYDQSRLPIKKRPSTLVGLPDLGGSLGWAVTSDEKRCFFYFQHNSVPSLVGFFDSQLWQQLALQMSRADPAVYHAANVLSALHEDSEITKMRQVGEDLQRPRHRFALEQATRSIGLLNRRRASQDPELPEIMLICCLIFVIAELLLGRYSNALGHLRNGLRILKETQESSAQPVALSIVEAFRFLDVQSSHYVPGGRPFLFGGDEEVEIYLDEDFDRPLQTLKDARCRVTRLLNVGLPFLAKRYLLSGDGVQAHYNELSRRQERILSLYNRFRSQFDIFYDQHYSSLSYKEQRGADTIRLQYLSQLVAIKALLFDGHVPDNFAPEYVTLLTTHEAFLNKYPERPTITLDVGIIPGLYTVAARSPRYPLRLKAIRALMAWPHNEGIINSNLAASLAIKSLKAELQTRDQRDMPQLMDGAEEELNQFLHDTMASAPDVTTWTSVRAAGLADKDKERSVTPSESGTEEKGTSPSSVWTDDSTSTI